MISSGDPPHVPTILCIDDDSTVLELHKAVLETEGYTVLTAADGLPGIERASSAGATWRTLFRLSRSKIVEPHNVSGTGLRGAGESALPTLIAHSEVPSLRAPT